MALVNLHCKECGTLGMFADIEGALTTGWTRYAAGKGVERNWICEYCTAEGKEEAKLPEVTPRMREEVAQEAYDLETIARFAELRTRLFVEGKIADQEHPIVCAGETVVETALRGMGSDAAVWWLQVMPSWPANWEAM